MKKSRLNLSSLTLAATLLFVFFLHISAWSAPRAPRRGLPKLKEPITSFGAAVLGEHLYVYSGHTGKAHEHTRDNLSTNFRRVNLRWSGDWEELPMEKPLQGLALVAWEGALYRVGGVHSRNAAGEPEDMHSTTSFARFNLKAKKWTALAPLPRATSSLDAAVLDGKLYAIGGWKLAGDPEEAKWGESYFVADLKEEKIEWKPMPKAPFVHRALAVAATTKRIYAIGGMDDYDSTVKKVFIFDPETQKWSVGPDLPTESRLKGSGWSAFGVGDTIWASGFGGTVFALDEGAKDWRNTEVKLESPRFFHRLLPSPDGKLLFIGGAGKEGHTDSIEALDLTLLNARSSASVRVSKPTQKVASSSKGQKNWPSFRGRGHSRTTAKNLPLSWSSEKNIQWKKTLAGYGQSSPVVWGNTVIASSVAGDNKEELVVEAYDLHSGEQRWVKAFSSSATKEKSDYISKGAPTPAIDKTRIYTFFESGDVIALNHTGDKIWHRSLTKEFGPFLGNHGVGSSVRLTSVGVVLLVDHDGPSYLICFDKKTGKTVWKNDREKRVSWSTPVVAKHNDKEVIIVSSNGIVESYVSSTGEREWFYEGLRMNTVPSPSVSKDLVVVGTSDKTSSIAVRRDGKGDVSETHKAWRAEDASSSFGSPLIHRGAVYYVNRAGVAFSNNLKTGKANWSIRLPDACWASPIGAGDHVYFFCKDGSTVTLEANAKEPVMVSESKLEVNDRVYGVAAVDGYFVVRTESSLVCIAASSGK